MDRAKGMTHCRLSSEHRSERAQEHRAAMTTEGFYRKLAFLACCTFTAQGCEPPQGIGPLPATGETRCSVSLL